MNEKLVFGDRAARELQLDFRFRISDFGFPTHPPSAWVAEAALEDGNGRLLGRGSGTFMRGRMRLADATGYGDEG